MPVVQLKRGNGGGLRQTVRSGRVYAIAFDIDTKEAERALGEAWRSAYGKISIVLQEYGFTGQQGSLYFGAPGSTPVDCFLAVRDLDSRYAWFGRIVRDLRMLRVEEQNDLLPILRNDLRFDQGTG